MATEEYRSQSRRTTSSESGVLGDLAERQRHAERRTVVRVGARPSGPNVRSRVTTVWPRDSASSMVATVSPGTLTIARWTSAGSSMPPSAMAWSWTASATLRIWPMRPISSGRIGSEPAMPTTRRLSRGRSSTSSQARVTATMCGEMTPGQPPESTNVTRRATSPVGMPRRSATQPRSAMSASTRPQSSWNPVPSVFPTRATSESGRTRPRVDQLLELRRVVGRLHRADVNLSTRSILTRSPPTPRRSWGSVPPATSGPPATPRPRGRGGPPPARRSAAPPPTGPRGRSPRAPPGG